MSDTVRLVIPTDLNTEDYCRLNRDVYPDKYMVTVVIKVSPGALLEHISVLLVKSCGFSEEG